MQKNILLVKSNADCITNTVAKLSVLIVPLTNQLSQSQNDKSTFSKSHPDPKRCFGNTSRFLCLLYPSLPLQNTAIEKDTYFTCINQVLR